MTLDELAAWNDAYYELQQRLKRIPPPPPRYPVGVPKGPLKSIYFALPCWAPCRQRLQAAADNHYSHIKPKTSGLHVCAIHNALNVLQPFIQYIPVPTPSDNTEYKLGYFGGYTEAKVVEYKTKCTLINRDYQNKVDNIVGIMTMRALDFHMNELERQMPGCWKDFL
jgi:hypothetical protein